MRIGVDARELSGRPTGVGRYLAGLLTDWSNNAAARKHEFVLYAAQPIAAELDTHRFIPRTVAGSGGTWWEQISVPPAAAADRLDAWFAPGYTAPLRLESPIVVAVHDLSFVAHPEWFRIREGMRRRFICGRTVAAARAVVTISEFSRRELIERLNVAENKIHVIPPAVHHLSPQPSALSHDRPRILFVGTIFNRRHVPDLVRAFAPIARAHADAFLDIVGDDRTYPREDLAGTIAAEALEGQVRWHQYVDDDRLRELYASARAFAFLSEYEGFGMTPLEALSAGVPSVLLDTPVARETCGSTALYVALNDLTATTEALQRLLFDAETRNRLLNARVHTLARYGPGRAGRDTLSVIENAALKS
ncbi:MAG TPA: glycosyltransferase family 1 protein [Vicinamibacterales bacterium]|jgi:glycosyltransferase involved in cell wall biosynthesis|nr:glycosyltransferase family 1 protein [Vicinamibacterales bacterium]